ncbi:hypothetical protein V7S43_009960 [Phytophthora oleae]|uniref:M96 mating-specific protein family n=1 Tax=Phytophthora oleae TaxID=2107226 RepID=A0ABD3FGX0_9STRA
MAITDAAFLAEVENFLLSTCAELPTLPILGVKDAARQTLSMDKHELEKVKDRKRRREKRERQQLERENLKSEIEKLKVELQRTQERCLTCQVSWKSRAERQLAARLSSEAQYYQLREAISLQTSVLQEFQILACECLDDEYSMSLGSELPVRLSQRKRLHLELADTEIFTTFDQEIDSVYARTDKTLLTFGLSSTEENWGSPYQTCSKDAGSGSLQFRGKVTLPFNFADVCQYRWQAAHLVHRQANREEYVGVEDPENTVALKFRVSTQLKSGQIATAIQNIVLRRYQEEERMVLVWRLFTEGEGAFSGLHSDETGWGVATPAKNVSTVGTVIRTCVTNVPMHFSNKAEQDYTLRQFNTKLLEWGLENNEIVNGLEKL